MDRFARRRNLHLPGILVAGLAPVFFLCGLLPGQETAPPAEAEAEKTVKEEAEPSVDEIHTRDGSVIRGVVKSMVDGSLKIDTGFGGEVSVKWADIERIRTSRKLPFVLRDGTTLQGLAEPDLSGRIRILSDEISEPSAISLGSVTAINPPEVKPVRYRGSINAGASLTDGNTRTRTGSLVAEFEARSKRQRLNLRGSYNYAEDKEGLTARNGKAGMKYDFFVTDRFFLFASSLFESDKFQDMRLRTALSAGPGYQLVEKGDFPQYEFLKDLESYVEAGISYVDEDRRRGEDESYVSARWAFKLDWPIVPGEITFFHFHEGYPGLERAEDLFVSTEQGLRFNLLQNLNATIQINWRWDNTPSPGFRRSDTTYLFTLGYNFDI